MTQGDPEKLLLETIDSFVVNSNFYEPPFIRVQVIQTQSTGI